MISRRWLAVSLLALGACGNYSNQDLEFMNALPSGSELAASIPARSSAISDAEEAELARTTHQFTALFNGMVESIVGLVDAVRAYPPSTRTPTSRTWGPYPTDPKKHPGGWQARLIVRRDPATTALFRYELGFHKAGGSDLDWPVLLSGQFQAGGSARRGDGKFQLTTAALRAEGFDPDLNKLDHMEVTYQRQDDPVTVTMNVTNLPDATNPAAVTSAVYTYKAAADGQGQMEFDFWANVIPGPALEKMVVTSQWRGSGEGRAVLDVAEGDGAGAMQRECWDDQFKPTFNDKPWMTGEDSGAEVTCPDIPLL